MTPENKRSSTILVIATIILGVLVVTLVEGIAIWSITIVTMFAGGFMWTKPAAWAYPVNFFILVASLLLSVFIIISLYRFLARSFDDNKDIGITPKYIYGIAILLPIVLPIVAYSAYTYSTYYSEGEETCLVNGLTYLKETEKCKQLDDPSYIEPNPSETQEPETNQLEPEQL